MRYLCSASCEMEQHLGGPLASQNYVMEVVQWRQIGGVDDPLV